MDYQQVGEQVTEVLKGTSLGGVSSWEVIISAGVLALTVLVKYLVGFVLKRIERRAGDSKKTIRAAMVHKSKGPLNSLILLTGVFIAIMVLSLPNSFEKMVAQVFQGLTMVIIVWGLLRLSNVFIDFLNGRLAKKNKGYAGFLPLFKKGLQIVITVLGVLLILDNLGYQVSGIIATLGIGGAALALASKDTIANVFGSLCFVLDRPFQVGDQIEVQGKLFGIVNDIGLRSTKVRTFDASIVSIPNNVLANDTINNWSKRPKRRVNQTIGLTYSTSVEQIEAIVADITALVEGNEEILQDFHCVRFTEFAESSLNIIVYYFTKTTVWVEHLKVKEAMNLEIMKIVQKHGSSMAFPSRTLYFGEDPLTVKSEYGSSPLQQNSAQ